MRFGYRFSNLCGTLYRQGNLVFSPDGNSILSPVGNRVSVFDLVRHSSFTLPTEARSDIVRMALSPNGAFLLMIDGEGKAQLVNVVKRSVLHHMSFKTRVTAAAFSPDGAFLAVAIDRRLQLWRTPSATREFAPFVLHRTLAGSSGTITCMDWSSDSRFIAVGSEDLSARVWSVHPLKNIGWRPVVLGGHKDTVVGVFFSGADDSILYTVSRDGTVRHWGLVAGNHEAVPLPAGAGASDGEEDSNDDGSDDSARSDSDGDGDDGEDDHDDDDDDDDDDGTNDSDETSDDSDDSDVESLFQRQQDSLELRTARARKRKPALSPLEYSMVNGMWKLVDKHFFRMKDRCYTVCAAHHRASGLLVVGFSHGVFGLYEMPDYTLLHTLSVSQRRIDTVAISPSGEWLGIASGVQGALLVWEWQSETYVLKQQSHLFDMNVLDYSPDGQHLVTGGDDGKVKVWNTTSGFCFVTFADHTAPVSGVAVAPNARAVITSSVDGTVRAYDLVRYRNFRTMTSPTPTQFLSLAMDSAGDIVAAGSHDPFHVYLWSLQTGRLLDVLAGHEGPVPALSFNPTKPLLASGSWDGTVRLWDVYASKDVTQTLKHNSDVLALAHRSDGDLLCVATLDGQLHFWDVDSGQLQGTIEGRRDIAGGRRATDRRTAASNAYGKAFTSVCFSADGACLLAGGSSRFLCIYAVEARVLLKRFQLTHNLSLDGVLDKLDSRRLTEAGPLDLIDDSSSDDDLLHRLDARDRTPGASKGVDRSQRSARPAARSKAVRFSPTGRAFAAATTEGLLIYSLDDAAFDPFDLDEDITPDAIVEALRRDEHMRALVMALRLNDAACLRAALVAVPVPEIPLLCNSLPVSYLGRMLGFVAKCMDSSPHLEYMLVWVTRLMQAHGVHLRSNAGVFRPVFRQLQQAITLHQHELTRLAHDNVYAVRYLRSFAAHGLLRDADADVAAEAVDAPADGDTAALAAELSSDDGADAVFAASSNWDSDDGTGAGDVDGVGDADDVIVAAQRRADVAEAEAAIESTLMASVATSASHRRKRKRSADVRVPDSKGKDSDDEDQGDANDPELMEMRREFIKMISDVDESEDAGSADGGARERVKVMRKKKSISKAAGETKRRRSTPSAVQQPMSAKKRAGGKRRRMTTTS